MGITTVTPCHGRVELVEKLLSSLQQSRLNANVPTETIIIDSSQPLAGERIRSLCKLYGARYLAGPLSVREKRNLGVREAQEDIVLFIDSDCEAAPALLAEHAQTYRDFPHISGVLGPTRFRGDRSWVWHVLRYTGLLDSFSFAEKYPYAMWGPCANVSLRKDVIVQAGLFQTNWPFRLGGDDLDLTLRITEGGRYIKCNPAAVIWHTTETWNRFAALCERSWRWGRMEYFLFRHHPRLRYRDYPKPVAWILFWILAGTVVALLDHSPLLLLLPTIWALLYLVVETTWGAHHKGWPVSRYVLLARFLRAFYEVGSVYQFLRQRDLAFLAYRVVYSEGQLFAEWDQRVIEQWSSVLAALGVLVFAALVR